MKKIAVFLLSALMVLSLTACGGNGGSGTGTGGGASGDGGTDSGTDTPATTTYKTGLGIAANMTSTDMDTDEDGSAEASVTTCAATFDTQGRIVSVTFDTVQCEATVGTGGTITVPDTFKSKKALGDDYGMREDSGIGKEWYEQVAALEYYCVGKTADEVSGMAVKNDDTHTDVPDVEELTSSCTISCTEFFSSLSAASANAK